VRQFDFDTITDVVLHVRYTAREGGDLLKAAAVSHLQTQINKAQTIGSVCLFSIRHDFPSEWAKMQSTSELSVALAPELYPFWAQGIVGSGRVKALEFFAELSAAKPTITVSDKNGNQDALVRNPLFGNLLVGSLVKIPRPLAISDSIHPLTVSFDDNSMVDLWMAITWGKG
jgi:hypothetical protein